MLIGTTQGILFRSSDILAVMASHALSRSLHSSRNHLSRNHLIAYLPSLSAAATYFRAFCSDYDRSDRTLNVEIMVESASDKNEGLPLTSWGPLGAADARFPLPGQMGIGSVEFEKSEDPHQIPLLLGAPKPSDLLTSELPFDRHVDIFHQFKSQIPNLLKERSKELRKDDVGNLEKRLLGISDVSPDDPVTSISTDSTANDYLLECSFFECPTLLKKDFNALFPEMDLTHTDFTVITLCQKTVNDMTGWSEDVDNEREQLLHSFFDAAQSMADRLKAAGFWADFIDPSSGKPFLSAHTNATLFETDDRFRHLGFEIEDLGCCKVVRHHTWGTHAYVGCVFTTAPTDHQVIQELTAKL